MIALVFVFTFIYVPFIVNSYRNTLRRHVKICKEVLKIRTLAVREAETGENIYGADEIYDLRARLAESIEELQRARKELEDFTDQSPIPLAQVVC